MPPKNKPAETHTETETTETEGGKALVATETTDDRGYQLPTSVKSLVAGTKVDGFEIEEMHSIAWLVPEIGQRYFLKMVSWPFTVAEEVMARGGKRVRQPATACKVVDLTTGELRQIIMGTVIYNELERNYPDMSWRGQSFMFIRQPERTAGDGKTRYNPYIIARVKTPDFAADFMDESVPHPKATREAAE